MNNITTQQRKQVVEAMSNGATGQQIIALLASFGKAKTRKRTTRKATTPKAPKKAKVDNHALAALMRANGLVAGGDHWAHVKALIADGADMSAAVKSTATEFGAKAPRKARTTRKAPVTQPKRARKVESIVVIGDVDATGIAPLPGKAKTIVLACADCGTTVVTKNPRQARCHDCSVVASDEFRGIIREYAAARQALSS